MVMTSDDKKTTFMNDLKDTRILCCKLTFFSTLTGQRICLYASTSAKNVKRACRGLKFFKLIIFESYFQEVVKFQRHKETWGGKRENAGRKKSKTTKQTKVARIPKEIDIEKLLSLREDLNTLIYAWKQELHETSPRDHTAKIMLEEIEKLLKD